MSRRKKKQERMRAVLAAKHSSRHMFHASPAAEKDYFREGARAQGHGRYPNGQSIDGCSQRLMRQHGKEFTEEMRNYPSGLLDDELRPHRGPCAWGYE